MQGKLSIVILIITLAMLLPGREMSPQYKRDMGNKCTPSNRRAQCGEELVCRTNQGGSFNEVLSIPLTRGTYVAQLEYHDLIVTDFFTVL